jgi:hypothetical protein
MKVHFHEKKISPSAGAVNAGEAAAWAYTTFRM